MNVVAESVNFGRLCRTGIRLLAQAPRLLSVGLFSGLIAMLSFPDTVRADKSWPDRPVTVIVPNAAGGNTDIIARIAADQLSLRLGQPFVVMNRPGAGGALGAQQVSRAAPDGYTVMFGAGSQLLLLPLVQKVASGAEKNIVPVVVFGSGAIMMAVKASLPVDTFEQFLAYAKANPGKLTYGVGGSMTVTHLAAALFVARAGLDMTAVNYRGGGQAIADLQGGNIDMFFGNSSELLSYRNSDKMKILAVTTAERIPQAPDLPAISEYISGFEMTSWQGFMVPAGTPDAIIERLAKESVEALKSPKVLELLEKGGVQPAGASGAELAKIMKHSGRLYREAVVAAGFDPTKPQ